MKIIFKTIVGKEIVKEVEPDVKVEDLKKLFEEDYAVGSLQFCYRGTILDTTKTLTDLSVEENGVIIIAGNKLRTLKSQPKPAEAVPSSGGTGSVKQERVEEGKPTESSLSTEGLKNISAPLRQGEGAPFGTPPAPALPAHAIDPSLTDSIVAMGFEDREQVVLALQAAYSNVDRAVEFLCTGIPDSAVLGFTGSNTNFNAAPEEPLQLPGRLVSQVQRGESESALQQALMNIPQFEEIRAIVESNPQSLSTVIQQLRIHHPEIIELIQQNPEEFMEIMGGPGMMGLAGSGDDGGGRSNVIEIPIREGERAAIQRLVELGGGTWDEGDALQAYRACEGDEEAAAHFLLSNFFGEYNQ